MSLPVRELTSRLADALRDGARRVIIHAPTGSGKSTQIPQMLMEYAPDAGQTVILEPRRIAARLLAARVAAERGVTLGREVGYQIRFDDCSSAATHIKFVTEAILFRRLLTDPELHGIGAVIFDEFHERHLYTDLTLGRIMELQATARPDLLILIMSATLDADTLSRYAAPCVVLKAEGRQWPITISYLERPVDPRRQTLWDLATAETADLLSHAAPTGDVLIFMPGGYEINRTIKALAAHPITRGCALRPLHGELPPAEQDRALEPADRRRIIVATNVAETSLTIDGVTLVVDSGMARIARFDQGRGINSLLIERISRAAADQRAGRAGRTAPGHCRRLWTEREHADRLTREDPEIKRIDLSEAFLLLKATGIDDLQAFRWLDPPDPQAAERAIRLLTDLGALASANGTITPLGRRMVTFPIHPRYARMLIAAGSYGCVRETALIAALTQERNLLLRRPGATATEHRERHLGDESDSDFFLLIRAWQEAEAHDYEFSYCERLGIHANAARQAGRAFAYFLRLAENAGLRINTTAAADDAVQRCILLGFADHVARCIDQGAMRYALVHARTGILARESMVRGQPLIVAADVSEIGRHLKDATVQLNLATAIRDEWLVELFPDDMHTEEDAILDEQTRRVVLRRRRMFHDLVLERKTGGDAPADIAAAILAETIVRGDITLAQWDHHVEQLLSRLRLVRRYCPELNLTEFDTASRQLFLTDLCQGKFSIKEARDSLVLPALRGWLGYETIQLLDRYAPERITLSNGRAARITYTADAEPFIATRIQELFGVQSIPSLAMGRCPLLLHILAPSQRPVQVTQDLPGFWRDHYPRIKRELQRKYPKHEWR